MNRIIPVFRHVARGRHASRFGRSGKARGKDRFRLERSAGFSFRGTSDPVQEVLRKGLRFAEQFAQVATGLRVDPAETRASIALGKVCFDSFPNHDVQFAGEIDLESIEDVSTSDSGDFPIKPHEDSPVEARPSSAAARGGVGTSSPQARGRGRVPSRGRSTPPDRGG